MFRPPVPWSGNPADRSKLNHIRRPDQHHQFQSPAGVRPASTIPRAGYFSDSETECIPGEVERFGWGGQPLCAQQAPACQFGERRIQEWTERNLAGASRPAPADYYTLGARRHRQVFNGTVPAVNAGVTVDNSITANTNRYVATYFRLPIMVVWWCSGYGVGLVIERSRVGFSAAPPPGNDSGQVVHTQYASVTKQYKIKLVPAKRVVMLSGWECDGRHGGK